MAKPERNASGECLKAKSVALGPDGMILQNRNKTGGRSGCQPHSDEVESNAAQDARVWNLRMAFATTCGASS